MVESQTLPVARLRDAFASRRCVSAWLGYGDVLFLGLNESALPQPGEGGQRIRPPFQVTTNFAEWLVEGPMSAGTADSDRAKLKAAAESLIGEQVVSWELVERIGLRLAFTGGKALTVVPWSKADRVSDAWCVESPDGRVLAVATDGRAVVVDATLPIRDWFGPVE